jgi:hypothetical protein
MKKKKTYWVGIIIILIIAAIFICLRVLNNGEDGWIKDSSGNWVRHGHPEGIPDFVIDSETVKCVINLYQSAYTMKMNFNSQCLGTCGNYSVDIVNVPRNSDDNLLENQCSDYKNNLTTNFIEIDKQGNIIRIS